MEETPWGYPDSALLEPPEPPIPLRFHQLFAESRPVNGQVDRETVQQLLARAHMAPDAITEILAANSGSNQQVDESVFVKILFDTARHLGQNPELLEIVPLPSCSDQTTVDSHAVPPFPQLDISGSRTIKVEILGKQGRWGFRHTVYIISGTLRDKPVLVHRRYSDFVWLLDYLVKVYPFRVLPLLPPKKIQLNGRFVSGDGSQFLCRRRLGLTRFLNILALHPITAVDQAVAAFLCDSSPVEILRQKFGGGQSGGGSQDMSELADKSAQPGFMLDFNEKKYTQWLDSLENSTTNALRSVTSAAKVLAVQSRRLYVQASDACNLTMDFEFLVTQMNAVYPDNQEHVSEISKGVATLAKYTELEHGAYLDSAAALQDGALEDIKYYRDVLLATKELFRRHRVLGGNTIIQQKNRIERLSAKIEALRGGGESAHNQISALESSIDELQLNIKAQVNRSWLMRQILSSELRMVQSSQFQLSRMIRNFASYKLAMTESFRTIATGLYDEVCDMPLR